MNKSTTIFLASFGLVGPIIFIVLLTMIGILWEGYNPITTRMSELGAVDSPYNNIMNYAGFSFLGACIIALSTTLISLSKKNAQMRIASGLLLIGGIFFFLVGFFPCDTGCIDTTQTGELHSFTSVIAAILVPFAIMLAAYPLSLIWSKIWGYFSLYIGFLSLAAGPMMFVESLSDYLGLIQRIGITLSLIWIVSISIKILRNKTT